MKPQRAKVWISFVAGALGLLIAAAWSSREFSPFRGCRGWGSDVRWLGNERVISQTHWNTCGAAALKMIFNHFNISADLVELEEKTEPWERGISMLALKRLAEDKGLRAEGWKFEPEDISRIPFPAVFFVRSNHYIVADSFSAREGLYIRDPSCGRLLVRKEVLVRSWSGESIIFHKTQ